MDDRVIEELKVLVENMIVELLGFDASVNISAAKDEEDERQIVSILVTGDDLGILIGGRGINLDAFQNIFSIALRNKAEDQISVNFDINEYRGRKEKSLENIAFKAAQESIECGVEVSLNPMSPAERRIVHLALENNEKVVTESQGEGENRYVIVKPVGS